MGKTLTEKLIAAHLVSGSMEPGAEVALRIDQTLTQDATGTMAYLEFESMGIDRVKTKRSVAYVDHNTLQSGFENADDHRYIQTVAAKHGIWFSRPGNGICHQVHLERFGVPGQTLIGSDSHTPTGGGIGMLAFGAGGMDVAVAMGGGAYYINMPRVIKIELTQKCGLSLGESIRFLFQFFKRTINLFEREFTAGRLLKLLKRPGRSLQSTCGLICLRLEVISSLQSRGNGLRREHDRPQSLHRIELLLFEARLKVSVGLLKRRLCLGLLTKKGSALSLECRFSGLNFHAIGFKAGKRAGLFLKCFFKHPSGLSRISVTKERLSLAGQRLESFLILTHKLLLPLKLPGGFLHLCIKRAERGGFLAHRRLRRLQLLTG